MGFLRKELKENMVQDKKTGVWKNKKMAIKELERKNRLLGKRCIQLLKDKGDLTDQIAVIKANCDLAIEGRDVKIMELEQELTVEKDLLQEETNLHLHAEDYIKSLEKENEELRNNGFTVSAMTEQQLKVAIEKGEQLEKENAELKEQNSHLYNDLTMTEAENAGRKERLHKAESLLQQYNGKASCCGQFMKDTTVQKLWEETKKFLKE